MCYKQPNQNQTPMLKIYKQEDENTKCKIGNVNHLSPSPDIVLTIKPDNLRYHVCKTYCPKISSIQRWMNLQLQYEKHFLVGVKKSRWFFLSFLSQCFIIIFSSQMSLSFSIKFYLFYLDTLNFNFFLIFILIYFPIFI